MVKKLKIKDKNKSYEIIKVDWDKEDGSPTIKIDKAVDPILYALIINQDEQIDGLKSELEEIKKYIGMKIK